MQNTSATFNATTAATPPHSSSVVNYVWVNDMPFEPGISDDEPECGVPLHYVDMAIANAKLYPDTPFQIWIDLRLLDKSATKLLLEAHLHHSGCKNIKIRDLREIYSYRSSFCFSPLLSDRSVWQRADMARLLVVRECLKEHPDKIAVYADFDVEDVSIETHKFHKALSQHGFIIGACEDGGLENAFFAFQNTGAGPTLLSKIIERADEFLARGDLRRGRNAIFLKFIDAVNEHLYANQMNAGEICLPDMLEQLNYRIPVKEAYIGLSIV